MNTRTTASTMAGDTASHPRDPVAPGAGSSPSPGLDPVQMQATLDGVHQAGVPGVFAEVRDAEHAWRGASGVADIETGRPVTADLLHRVGSITKTFTAAGVLQQVEQGQVGLDAPIGRYLPRLVPGSRGMDVTIRMLLNHSSGIADYLPSAFPSLDGFPSRPGVSAQSLDDNRYRRFDPAELIGMGLQAPAASEPGSPTGTYSNTNYLILGQLLHHVTGATAERYIAEHVIERAGLQHTMFPTGPDIEGPHAHLYEALYGLIEPPRDYSVYDMSWVGPAAALVSTVSDLNRFYDCLLAGTIVNRSTLAQMQRTIPVVALDGQMIEYGLGLHKVTTAGCGTFWGSDGTVWGANSVSLTRSDRRRQLSIAMNLVRWNKVDGSGRPQRHPIDDALAALYRQAAVA